MLDLQASFFKLMMVHNVEGVLAKKSNVIPVSQIWIKVVASAILSHKLPEYMKLAKIAAVGILGSMKDERTFSNLTFIKNKLCNRLTNHLMHV